MGIGKKLASETAAYGLSSILARLINYLFGFFIVKYISTEDYGVYSKMYAYAGFLLVFLTHGMETTFFRFLHKDGFQKKAYSTAFTSVFITTVLFVLSILVFIRPASNFIEEAPQLIRIFIFIMAFDVLSALPFASLRAQNRPLKFAFYKIFNIGIFILFNILFFIILPYFNIEITSSKVDNIFIANLIASVLTFVLLFFQAEKVTWSIDKKQYKEMLLYGLPIMLVGFAGMINEMLDRAMMTKLLPYDTAMNNIQLGIYSFNYKFAMPISMFLQAYRFAAEPIFFREAGKVDNKKIYADMMKFYIIAACFIFLGIVLMMPTLKTFFTWYTSNAAILFEGVFIVPILLIANLCLGAYFNISTWYKITDKTQYGAIIAVVGAIITVVLNFILVPKIGYAGGAWATMICYISMLIIGYVLERKYYPIPYQHGRIALYVGVTLAISFVFNQYISEKIVSMAAQISMAVATMFFYSLLVYVIEKRK